MCVCGHEGADHTEWGKGPCEFIRRGADGEALRRDGHPNGVILRCECPSFARLEVATCG